MRVAFLGLGIMGRSMAANLVKAGHEVSVWNRTSGKDKEVEGARTASSPADAAKGVEAVWMCVSDTKAAESVLFGPNGVSDSLAEGMIIADSSTISPAATLRFAERVKAKGVAYVDAPMTGSKIAAAAGSLIFMVGGNDAALARLQPLFQAMGKQVFHMGETGKGQATKLAMNLQIAMIFEGFAEALTLASKLGVDIEKMLPLIQASMVRSGVVEYKAPFILQRDFSPKLSFAPDAERYSPRPRCRQRIPRPPPRPRSRRRGLRRSRRRRPRRPRLRGNADAARKMGWSRGEGRG